MSGEIVRPVKTPVKKEDLLKELTVKNFLRGTNKGNNQIFLFHGNDYPNLMQEVGRLRELTFRDAGGGTGNELDIDEFDKTNFKQIIVWDPEEGQIVGGYRFAFMKDLIQETKVHSPAAEIFGFSDKFVQEIAPYTIELGRSFVQPYYQRQSRKGAFSLDNLFDGLGSLVVDYPEMKYFFGKMTMYKTYNREARNLILYFLEKHFPDNEDLVFPLDEFKLPETEREIQTLKHVLDDFISDSYEDNKKLLLKALFEIKIQIPPLFKSYMELSPNMKVFGTSNNPYFGNVEETGILVTIDSIYPEKKDRHVETYRKRQ